MPTSRRTRRPPRTSSSSPSSAAWTTSWRAAAPLASVRVSSLPHGAPAQVYFTLALSARITWVELVIGVTIGAVMIAAVVGVLLEASETLTNCIENVPVPFVLVCLAVYLVISCWVPNFGV